jgi:O-antigen ligase
MWVLLIVCFLSCVIGLLQVTGDGRVFSPFESRGGEPNTFGGYLLLMLSMCLGLLITQGSIRYKTWIIALAVLICITLAATLSRSSWLGLFPMLAVLLYLCKKKLIVIAPLVLILVVSPFVMPKSVKERALYTFTQKETEGQIKVGDVRFDTSTSARLNAWHEILTVDLKNHPLLGYGVTGYGFVDAQYPRVLIESGILGLISFLFLMVMMLKSALRVFRQTTDPLYEGISLGYLIGMAGLLTHGIGANTFIIVRIMDPFWFMTAMVVMMPTIEKLEREKSSTEMLTAR